MITRLISKEMVLPKQLIDKYGSHRSDRFVPLQICQAAQKLLDYFCIDKITINTDKAQQRGRRILGQRLYRGDGAHDLGLALDILQTTVSLKEIHETMALHSDKFYEMGITRVETIDAAPTWLHIDCMYSGEDSLIFVDLTRRFTADEYLSKLF